MARVLPNPYSIRKSLELGLPGENLIAMQGTFTPKFNKALIREYGAEVVLTKDSGAVGGTTSKIEAALDLKIPIIVVLRPEILELKYQKVSSSVRRTGRNSSKIRETGMNNLNNLLKMIKASDRPSFITGFRAHWVHHRLKN